MLCPWMNQLELWSMSGFGLTTVVNRELANYYQLVKLGSYFLFASYYVDGEINMQSLSLEIAEATASIGLAVAASLLALASLP